MDQQFVIEVFNLTKSFPGVIALDDINLKVRAGSVHCIIGENGAGKSTLVRALTGLYKSDAGRILIDGRDVSVHRAAHDLIACVPQEIDLFPNMTVAENLFMPFNKSGMKGPFVSKKMMNQRAKERLAEFHINVNPQEMVRNISIAHQQLLQIARAETQTGYKVLIMDEPTTSLTNLEIEVLFRIVKRLQSEGKTIIFISHKLEEMFAIGTHVSILRNGCLVGELPIEQVDSKWIVTKMSGEEIDIDEVFRPTVPGGDVVMKVQHLDGIRFSDVSFEIREGEVLGFAGLIGAGRSELMQSILGYLKYDSGSIEFKGKKYKSSPPNALRSGIVYLPEERKQQGIFPSQSVQHNLGIALFKATSKLSFIRRSIEKNISQQLIEKLDVKTSGLNQQIMYLSGGNQQKSIIGRAIFGKPKLIIFDEPTKGIDVKAKAEIHRRIRNLAEQERIAIILVSSEMDEIIKCTSRIITFYMGRKTAEFYTGEIDKSVIMREIIGAAK